MITIDSPSASFPTRETATTHGGPRGRADFVGVRLTQLLILAACVACWVLVFHTVAGALKAPTQMARQSINQPLAPQHSSRDRG